MAAKDTIRAVFTAAKERHIRRILKLRRTELTLVEYKNLIVRRDEWKACRLSDAQKKAIDLYFQQHYGRKIPYYWHRMYTAYTGCFDEKYMPELLFSTLLEEKLNPYFTAFPLQNKAFNPQCLFAESGISGVTAPEMILHHCAGNLWDAEGRIITSDQAADLMNDCGEVIIKPTIDTMGARGVRLLDMTVGTDCRTGEQVDTILASYGSDYIVQRRVKCHPSIARIYSDAVNTLRVITFVCRDGVKAAPLSMRIGMGGRIVDNGGIFIGVEADGQLHDTGFSKKGITRYKEHPDTGVRFADCRIEGVGQMVNAAITLHARLPQLKMLSWDMAYDEAGNVVIIEVNTTAQSVWFPQMVTGRSIFGDYTDEMLALIRHG